MRLIFLVVTFLLVTSLVVTPTATPGEVPPGLYFVSNFEKVRELELFSLDPSGKGDEEGFHGYKVLGKTTVKDAETLKGLVDVLRSSVKSFTANVNKDFPPRHGIRFKLGDTTVDVVLCCRTKVFYDNKKGADFGITKALLPAFDKVLKAAGIELAKPAE